MAHVLAASNEDLSSIKHKPMTDDDNDDDDVENKNTPDSEQHREEEDYYKNTFKMEKLNLNINLNNEEVVDEEGEEGEENNNVEHENGNDDDYDAHKNETTRRELEELEKISDPPEVVAAAAAAGEEERVHNRSTIISNVDSVYYHNEIDLNELEANEEEEDNDRHTSTDNKEVNDFIQEAIRFGANALDLSKRSLYAVPKVLFKLDILQYLYLESNMLTELPINFFTIFVNLKWLDLRSNRIIDLPLKGLANHENLRYLLLENNQIRRLPVDLAYVPNLTALNLLNNPLEFPPLDIVNKGIKYVKDYLRANCTHRSEDFLKAIEARSEEPNIVTVNDDLWASDDDDAKSANKRDRTRSASKLQQLQQPRTKSTISYTGKKFFTERYFIYNLGQPADTGEKKTTLDKLTNKLLITQPLQPANEANIEIRSRLNRAKSDANSLSKTVQRKRMLVPFDQKKTDEFSVYKNITLEKAMKTGTIDKYKKFKEKTDAQLQKVKDVNYVEEFRDEMKEEQRKLQYKRLIKGVDYEEPINRAPFDIDEDYIMIMSKEEREKLDKRLMHEKMRSLSPETLWRIEEERRQRDHALQDKIREYTKKLLDRREAPKGAPRKDRLEAAKDLRELRTLEKELQQRQREIQFGFNAYSGDLRYRETAKINNSAKAANFLSNNNRYK